MRVMVLKDFAVAVDQYGVRTRALVAETVDEIPDDAFDGLKAEGYVTEFTAEVEEAVQAAEAVDLHFASPHGHMKVEEGLTRQEAATRVEELTGSDEPAPYVRVEPAKRGRHRKGA